MMAADDNAYGKEQAVQAAEADALDILSRREALSIGCAAALLAPAAPAFAKSKASVNPNKPEGIGANAKAYQKELYKAEKQGMTGDKGSRGVASKDFDAQDSVVKN